MGGGGAMIGRSFISVLRVHYEGVARYHPVLARQSFQPLDDGATTGYAQLQSRSLTKLSVQHIRAVRTSAESSPVRLFFLLIQSFQAPLSMGYILTKPSSRT